jgi:nucleotide-binding universal stress UspA family protein
MTGGNHNGPILFAYDGSEHAKAAIRQARGQLRDDRRAIVLTVWQPAAAQPFVPAPVAPPKSLEDDIGREARRVAEEGAELARASGFDAEPSAEPGDPVWQRIVQAAEDHDASIVVVGSHGRTGLPLILLGSVAAATARHTERPVLIAHSSGDAERERPTEPR